jgi:hypothetical protein
MPPAGSLRIHQNLRSGGIAPSPPAGSVRIHQNLRSGGIAPSPPAGSLRIHQNLRSGGIAPIPTGRIVANSPKPSLRWHCPHPHRPDRCEFTKTFAPAALPPSPPAGSLRIHQNLRSGGIARRPGHPDKAAGAPVPVILHRPSRRPCPCRKRPMIAGRLRSGYSSGYVASRWRPVTALKRTLPLLLHAPDHRLTGRDGTHCAPRLTLRH